MSMMCSMAQSSWVVTASMIASTLSRPPAAAWDTAAVLAQRGGRVRSCLFDLDKGVDTSAPHPRLDAPLPWSEEGAGRMEGGETDVISGNAGGAHGSVHGTPAGTHRGKRKC